jgi:hypothetical protein
VLEDLEESERGSADLHRLWWLGLPEGTK